jgi:hypothetical protein
MDNSGDMDTSEIDHLEIESEEEIKRNERFKRVRSDSFRMKKTQSTKVANIGGKMQINDEVTKLEEEIRLVISNTSDYVLHPSEMYYVKKNSLHLPVRSLTTNHLECNHLDKFNEDLLKEEKKKEEEKQELYVKRFNSKKNVKFSVKKVVFEYNDNKELPDFVPTKTNKRGSILSTKSKFSNINKEIPKLSESSDDDSASDSSDNGGLSQKEKEKLNELKRKRQEREIAKKVELEEEIRRKEEIALRLAEEKTSKKNDLNKSNSSGKSKKSSDSSGSKKKGKKK